MYTSEDQAVSSRCGTVANHTKKKVRTYIFTFLNVIGLAGVADTYAVPPTAPTGEKWKKVEILSDEFEGTALDTDKWTDYHPHWDGREPSEYKPGNAYLKNGQLCLKSGLKKDPSTVADKFEDIWVDAAACVSKNRSAKPGYYYEALMKASNLSMTSSFWFRVGDYSEIDVIEHIGNPSKDSRDDDLPYEYHANTHVYKKYSGKAIPASYDMETRGRDEYHLYGFWWKDPETLIFYHNNEEVMRIKPRVPFEEDLKMIFDTEVFPFASAGVANIGLPLPENLNDDTKNTMYVEYVRTYELKPGVESADPVGDARVSGDLKKWHTVTLEFDGPDTSEAAAKNPFTDYRLNVTFTNGTDKYVVPGFYAADGNAAETSAVSGNKWQVRFTPPATGNWQYTASFRTGNNIAVKLDRIVGEADASIDGQNGRFTILDSDKTGRDFRGKGRLEYTGEHYLQFADNKEVFLKAGADSPENFLSYEDFDNTTNNNKRRKSWSPHQKDYDAVSAKSYTWKSGKGTEVLGAVKYLSDQGMNVFSMLLFNVEGDEKNVFPHLQKNNNASKWADLHHTRFDVSKMEQWEKVLAYGEKMGMYLHFKLSETENEDFMDKGAVGIERKVFYREMVARFGHHLALNWNLGEENGDHFKNQPPRFRDQTDEERKQMAKYLKDIDPYDNHIVLHTAPNKYEEKYRPLLGNKSQLTGVSIQTDPGNVHKETKKWVDESAKVGKKWVVANDEQGNGQTGVAVDASFTDVKDRGTVADNRKLIRHEVLWGNLMAGGAGVEYYFGGNTGQMDLNAENYRTRATKWKDAKNALNFFNTYLPFADMKSMDTTTANNKDYVFGKAGEVYAVYLPNGGSTNITLPGSAYSVQWYNPRAGGNLTTKQTITNSISAPNNNDWVALVTRDGKTIVPTNKGGQVTPPTPSETYTFSAVSDFEVVNDSAFVPFYVDNARSALAVNASQHKGKFAAAKTVFDGESGTYDVKIATMTEKDGESTYKLLVNGAVKGTFQNPETTQEFEVATHTWSTISIAKGDTIRIEFNSHTNGKIPEGSSTAYSRGRWTSLILEKTGDSTTPPANVAVTGITISQAPFTLRTKGAAKQLSASITPAGATNKTITWSSNKPGVATVDSTGKVNAVANGTAVITAKSNNNKTATVNVTVNIPAIPPASNGNYEEKNGVVIIDAENTTLNGSWAKKSDLADYGGTGYIESTHANSYGTVPENSKIEYSIKINTPGTYRLHMHTRNGVGAGAADAGNDSWVNVNSAKFFAEFSRENGEFIKNGSTYTATTKGDKFTVDYKNSRGGYVKYFVQSLTSWKWGGATSRHKYIYDSAKGEYKSKETGGGRLYAEFDKAGDYKLTLACRSKGHLIDRIVLYKQGTKAPFDIALAETLSDGGTTPPPSVVVTGVTIGDSPFTLRTKGRAKQLSASVVPANATNKTVTWKSNKPGVATVDSTGNVKAVSNGTAVITATSNNSKTASVSVTVAIPDPVEPPGGETALISPIHDAYLQGTSRFNNVDLRVEYNKRVSYLQFDLSSVSKPVASLTLQLPVGSDSGNGTIVVSQGNSSNWTETNLSDANKPSSDAVLAESTSVLSVGQTYKYDVSDVTIPADGKVTFIVTMKSGGNDVSFASKENAGTKPSLEVTYKDESNKGFSLEQGYQIVSLDYVPEETNIKELFRPAFGTIEFVQNKSGKKLYKKADGTWKNDIGDWIATQAYIVKAKGTVQIDVAASTTVTMPAEISLKAGVNLVPVHVSSMKSLKVLFQSILDTHIVWVRDLDGNYLRSVNGTWIDRVDGVKAGSGLVVKVSNDCSITRYLSDPDDESAYDWKDVAVPADPGAGKKWKLQESFSDDFNYTGKGEIFSSKWNNGYFNKWTGPGLTHWESDQSEIKGGNLHIKASRRAGTNKVNCGVITSKEPVIYPVYMEACIKVSNLELSSNFWMLSNDSKREIDALEVYGGAANEWFAKRMSTNFHVFLRDPDTNSILSDFNDQSHNEPSTGTFWRDEYHTFGVYWKSPSEITFYIDGVQTAEGAWDQVVMVDKDYTGATMDKSAHTMDREMYMILDTEDHEWRSNSGIVASDADLADSSKNTMYVDWVRTYKPVDDN